MVTLGSIQAVRDTATESARVLERRTTTAAASTEDAVEISPEAAKQANLAQLARQAADSEVRQQKVEEAKRRLEEGTYRLASIANVVAERISGLVAV